LQYKILATSLKHRTTYILSISEAAKKVEKFALLITPEAKYKKQQNQATHSFHWQPYQTFPYI